MASEKVAKHHKLSCMKLPQMGYRRKIDETERERKKVKTNILNAAQENVCFTLLSMANKAICTIFGGKGDSYVSAGDG